MEYLKKYWLLLLIITVAVVIRLYRIETLTSFQGDQGRDLFAVYQLVGLHDIKLLGSPSTFGPYQGPLYYYILAPSMFISSLYPIGPLVMAVLWNVPAIATIYLFCEKFLTKKIAIICAFLFAFSPLLIETGRTLLNAYFGLPLLIGAFYITTLLVAKKKFNSIYVLLLGFLAGNLVQLHFSFVPFAIFCLLVPFFAFKGNKLRFYLYFTVSFLIASSPQILFEVTHNFLSTKLLFSSLASGRAMTGSFSNSFSYFFTSMGYLFGLESFLYGLLVVAVLAFGQLFKKENVIKWLIFFLLFFLAAAVLSRVRLEANHYYMSIYPIFLILAAIVISRFHRLIQLLILIAFVFLSVHSLDLGRNNGFTMVPNWSLSAEQKVAETVASDAKNERSWNIAEVLDGDTRALQLRYLLSIRGAGNYLGVEDYPKSRVLYLVSWEKPDSLVNSNVWEVASFKTLKFVRTWQLKDGINVYRIERK